ncbi:MAG: hypothetical protein ACRC9H_05755, partial [Aeromonas veronii]
DPVTQVKGVAAPNTFERTALLGGFFVFESQITLRAPCWSIRISIQSADVSRGPLLRGAIHPADCITMQAPFTP